MFAQVLPVLLPSLVATASNPQDYQALLAGRRIVMDGARFAGFQFNQDGTALLFAEIARDNFVCKARFRWVAPTLIYLVENGRTSENCAPRTWLLKIEKAGSNHLSIREFDSCWPSGNDLISKYTIVPRSRNIE